jgi:hypothetical protein
MDALKLAIEAIVGAAVVVGLVKTLSPKWNSRGDRRRTSAWGFDPTEAIPPETTAALRFIDRGRLMGAAVGLAIGFVIWDGSRIPLPVGIWSIYGPGVVGYALGCIVTGVVVEARRSRSDVRIARGHSVALIDYVPDGFRALAWVAVALCIIQTTAGAILGSVFPSTGSAVVPGFQQYLLVSIGLTGGSLATLIIFEVAGRVLIQRGQPAGTSRLLMWGDALRGSLLANVLGASLLVGSYAAEQSFILLTYNAMPSWVRVTLNLFAAAVVIGLIVNGLRLHARGPSRQYLRRLWPKEAAAYDAREAAAYAVQVAALTAAAGNDSA